MKRPIVRKPIPVVLYAPVSHAPDDLCGGRRLKGAEFEYWKRHYEKIDRERRLKAKGDENGR